MEPCKVVILDSPTLKPALSALADIRYKLFSVSFFSIRKKTAVWKVDRMLYLWQYLPQYVRPHVGDAISSCFTFTSSTLTF